MRVLITGATGLVGQALLPKLIERGYEVVAVTRDKQKTAAQLSRCHQVIEHNLDQAPLSKEKLTGVHACIHLAGENIAAQRWSDEVKAKILSSRTVVTQNLVKSLPSEVAVLIASSAIGFYGDRNDEVLTEDSSRGSGYLSEVCQQWEDSSSQFKGRRVLMRTGLVLSARGGALAKMKLPFSLGLGGALGKGTMWMSWIHIDDLTDLFVYAIENNKLSGVYNAVAPEPVLNLDFSKSLAAVLKRPLGPRVPEFALKLAFGEMSSVLLASQRVTPSRFLEEGYHFRYQEITQALMSLIQKK